MCTAKGVANTVTSPQLRKVSFCGLYSWLQLIGLCFVVKCGSEEIALNKTVGLVTAHRGEHGKCVNKKAIPSFKECIGICHSSTSFNASKSFLIEANFFLYHSF
jgi:hypothetical protein